ncbi:MAG TPA: 30S ribosomal protein S9 [Candidatus Kaiserbacteria bacterium]|nr:30S ribosomal protein S9 [Candidatus Kaiserbacteria bacterium]
MSDTKYITAVGRRKTAVARVRMVPASKMSITINDMPSRDFLKTDDRERTAHEALHIVDTENYAITVHVSGGGLSAQADAIRHGIARALEKVSAELRPTLKKAGYLTRDPRAKERKKPGLKKARKAPQWRKR